MTIALVGSVGTVATGTTSCVPAFAQTTTAGNFLAAWVASDQTGTQTPPTGWSIVTLYQAAAAIMYKANCATGETAPTFTTNGSTIAAAMAEFSGVATSSPEDQNTFNTSITSPLSISNALPDAAGGELVLTAFFDALTKAGTVTTADAYGSNATSISAGNNDATSTAFHYRFSYAITTGNGIADTVSHSNNSMNLSSIKGGIASFRIAAVVPPSAEPLRVGASLAAIHASNW